MKHDRYKLIEQQFEYEEIYIGDIVHIENVSYAVAEFIKKMISTDDTDKDFLIVEMDGD